MNKDNIHDKMVFDVFNEYFSNIQDPRQVNKIEHLLNEILFISVLAVVSGADDFHEIEHYARNKKEWLSSFLALPGGIPSHDTFNRVLCMISAREFEDSFVDWVSDIRTGLTAAPGSDNAEEKDVISIDGKAVCNSRDKNTGTNAIHMVSALSSKYGLILGQQKCSEKSNEITAIPLLLNMLLIDGAVITIDAMGCQKNIASKIIGKNADYILALKANQENLYKEVAEMFDKTATPEFKHYIHQQDIEIEKDHGRIEQRQCFTIQNLDWLYETRKWKGVRSIVKIVATVDKDGKQTEETRYYISSLPGNANFINRAVRKHWFIENKLHWVLDVLFREDYSRVRTGNGAENLTIIRKIALNVLKRDNSVKTSLKNKRKMCSWNDNYTLNILKNMKA